MSLGGSSKQKKSSEIILLFFWFCLIAKKKKLILDCGGSYYIICDFFVFVIFQVSFYNTCTDYIDFVMGKKKVSIAEFGYIFSGTVQGSHFT